MYTIDKLENYCKDAITAILSYYECLCEEDANVDMMFNEIIK